MPSCVSAVASGIFLCQMTWQEEQKVDWRAARDIFLYICDFLVLNTAVPSPKTRNSLSYTHSTQAGIPTTVTFQTPRLPMSKYQRKSVTPALFYHNLCRFFQNKIPPATARWETEMLVWMDGLFGNLEIALQRWTHREPWGPCSLALLLLSSDNFPHTDKKNFLSVLKSSTIQAKLQKFVSFISTMLKKPAQFEKSRMNLLAKGIWIQRGPPGQISSLVNDSRWNVCIPSDGKLLSPQTKNTTCKGRYRGSRIFPMGLIQNPTEFKQNSRKKCFLSSQCCLSPYIIRKNYTIRRNQLWTDSN